MWIRAINSCLLATRVPRSMVRAILLNRVSTMFNQEPAGELLRRRSRPKAPLSFDVRAGAGPPKPASEGGSRRPFRSSGARASRGGIESCDNRQVHGSKLVDADLSAANVCFSIHQPARLVIPVKSCESARVRACQSITVVAVGQAIVVCGQSFPRKKTESNKRSPAQRAANCNGCSMTGP